MESIVLSASPLTSVVIAMVNPAALQPAALASLTALNDVANGLAPVVERFFTVWVHILANVLIFYAVVTKRPGPFWLAFLYKTGIDTIAAYAQVSGLLASSGAVITLRLWAVEAVVAVWGIVGWLGTRWVARHYPVLAVTADQPEHEGTTP